MKQLLSLIITAAMILNFTAAFWSHAADDTGDLSPGDMSGLLGWFDASQLYLNDGDEVSSWKNLAGGGAGVQSDSSRRPTFVSSGKIGGKPAVRFTKSSYLELSGSYDLDDVSVFAVINVNTVEGGTDGNQIFSKLQRSSPHHHNWYFNIKGGLNFGWHDDAGYHDYNGADRALYSNTDYILAGVKNGGNGQMYINGNALGVYTSTDQSPTASHCDDPVFIGGCGASGEEWSIDGDIGELLLFDRGLTAEEVKALNGYLSEKWGINTGAAAQPDGQIFIDGQPLRPFSQSITEYKHILPAGTAEIPEVSADFEGKTRIVQASSLPGRASVTAEGKTFYIDFEVSDMEIKSIKNPEIEQVEITGGFWKEKLELFSSVTVKHVLDNLENSGTLQNFDNIAKGTDIGTRTSPWNDGLLYETIRGAADFLRSKRDPDIEKQIDGYIERIYAASMTSDTGYLSTAAMKEKPGLYFDATGDARWYHDCYNFGCMAEAAVHYYKAVGESPAAMKFLFVTARFAEFLADNYGYGVKPDGTPKINMVPSHEGPEEQLLKLYRLFRDKPELKAKIESYDASHPLSINEEEYADLVKFWIENRGVYENRINGANYGVYAQDHEVYYNQTCGAGHAVRANLFYTGMAAAGLEFSDPGYISTAQTIYDNITKKQMYVTGGVGSTGADEAYGADYDLPNTGYCETCAQAAMGFFSEYMSLISGDSKYADTVEKDMYNGVLGCIGQDGKSFYYVQPLTAVNSSRWEWIDYTPCCPPMFLKFYSEMPTYIYSYTDTDVYVNQFISSRLTLESGFTVAQDSEMPWGGKSVITANQNTTLHIRIPDWADKSKTEILQNGIACNYTLESGYAVIPVSAGDTVTVDLPMEARRVYNPEEVTDTAGMVSFAYGPLNYCFEKADNPYVANWSYGEFAFGVDRSAKITAEYDSELLGGVVALSMPGKFYNTSGQLTETELKAVPFYARSNRGAGTSYVFVGEEPKNNAGDFRRWLASATSVSSVGESAAAAFDGNPDTAWVAGGAEYPQGLIVDLGESKDIDSVRLTFPSKQAWKYKIMCSSDGESWQEYADNSQNSDNISVYNETAKASARYVALLLVESAGVGYATVSEIEVFEEGGTQNLALNKMCGASSVNETGFSAFSMIDGNNSTRYCPDGESKPQTVTFDLGGDTSFEGLEILFEKPTRWTYNVQLSSDGINWSEYVSETFDMSSDGQLRTIEKSGKARYLRISITATTGGVWASVWDIRLMNPSGGSDLFESLLSYAGKPEEPDDPAKLRGDINKDGVVNVSDILTLKNLIMSGKYTDEQLKAGDLDENGTLTVGDILSVKDIIMSGK